MWRQLQVDAAYRERVRRALFSAFARRGRISMAIVVVCAALVALMTAQLGTWLWLGFAVAMVVVPPLSWWRTSARLSRQLPLGSWVAYAVTPDGGFHTSSVVGTSTFNPGHVHAIQRAGDCWLLAGASPGIVMVVPHELLPDADVELLRAAQR